MTPVWIDRAAKFLDVLLDLKRANTWVFRGQADSHWLLLPPALRGSDFVNPMSRQRIVDLQSTAQLVEAEAMAVRGFLDIAVSAGLDVADDPVIHDALEGWTDLSARTATSDAWPPPQLLPILCTAQRCGLPTRLLAFSTDPRVAIYHAAREAAAWSCERQFSNSVAPGVTHLSVWAIRGISPSAGKDRDTGRFSLVRIESEAGTGTCYLAQRVTRSSLKDVINRRPWHLLLREAPDLADLDLGVEQLCLPIEEAPELLQLLSQVGFNAATIFRSPHSIVDAMREIGYRRASAHKGFVPPSGAESLYAGGTETWGMNPIVGSSASR